MAPVRTKSANKRFLCEVSPVKEVKNSTMTRKNKFSKLGPPWTTNELRRFYKAYRLHGKSWKKVAAEVHNRSVEMVEALYNLNRAYLALPEGTATVRGLVAMMTDHYSALEEVESEGEGDDGSPELVQRPKKQKLDRIKPSTSKADHHHFHPFESTDGCLSLLKEASFFGGLPRAVGKRTPRVPVSSLDNKDDDVNSASGQQSDIDIHAAALALTEASNRRYSQLLPRKELYDGAELSDNEKEACRGTEVKIGTTFLGSATTEVLSSKSNKCSRGGKRRKPKEVNSGDEFLDLDALQMLADLSAIESESISKLKEERAFVDRNDKSDIPEATTPSGHEKEALEEDELLSSFQRVQGCYTKKQKSGSSSASFKPAPEAKQLAQSTDFNSSERKIQDVTSEPSNEDETNSSAKLERSDLSRQVKPTLAMDGALTAESMKTSFCIDGSTEPSFLSNQVILSTGRRSRIKADMKRTIMQKGEKILKIESDKQLNPLNDRRELLHPEEKPFCCLSSPMFRRWCSYEWFYNAIDYPWFANQEFVEYLNHVGLGHIWRLTRFEWGVIRSSLGKPRRFSHRFLHEETEKLKKYRESVRTHYSELCNGARDGLPRDLAKPLLVGQRVIAFHPEIRELHDGSVLGVECGRCRIHFDCPQFGVEFVEDIDCMPLNPMNNMPESLRTQRLQVREHSKSSLASSCQQENGPSPLKTIVNQPQVDKLHFVSQTAVAGADVTTQHGSCLNLVARDSPREADRANFPGLTCSFDAQASSLLKPCSSSTYARGTPSYSTSCFHHQESESMANDILRTSRSKAAIMVDTAVHEPYLRTRKALDPADDVNGSSCSHNLPSHDASEPKVNADLYGSGIEALIPTELITSCVATFLTIKTCSEKRYPPADVAEAIESALASLHPCCPQNLPLYRDIQTRMRMIKTQILSVVPT